MADPTPTLDEVLDAVVNRIHTLDPLPGTVLHFESPADDEQEFLEEWLDADDGIRVWTVGASVRVEQGPSAGEKYNLYDVHVTGTFSLPDQLEQYRLCVKEGERVRTVLAESSAVFQIGGRRHLLNTPEDVAAEYVEDEVGGMKVHRARLTLTVEARRWS